MHEWISKHEDIVVRAATYDRIAGFPARRTTCHLSRTLVETRVTYDRPTPLRPVVDLDEPFVVVRSAYKPDFVSASRVHVRVMYHVHRLDRHGRPTTAVRPVPIPTKTAVVFRVNPPKKNPLKYTENPSGAKLNLISVFRSTNDEING